MNRWRARLAELQSDAFVSPAQVQNVQIVQKSASVHSFGRFEQIEQQREPAPAPRDDARTDAEEERAAIADGGAPRAWAEGFARLNPNTPPADVPPRRWLRFIDDCGRFLDQGWALRAAALGWGPLDLFGCDRERPFARVDRAGLLWLLNGRKLVAFTADTATIETPTGAHQTYRRESVACGEVAFAWELDPLNSGKDKPDEAANDGGPLGKPCAYCGRGELLGDPLLDAAVDGDMFRAHRACLEREWQSWQR